MRRSLASIHAARRQLKETATGFSLMSDRSSSLRTRPSNSQTRSATSSTSRRQDNPHFPRRDVLLGMLLVKFHAELRIELFDRLDKRMDFNRNGLPIHIR